MVFDGLWKGQELVMDHTHTKALTQIDHDVLIAEEEHAGARVI